MIRIVLEELPSVFAALAEPFTLEREPRAALFDDVLIDRKIQKIAFARDAFAIQDVELGFAERWSNLVLDDLYFGAASHHFVAIFDRSNTPHVHAHGRVEL